MPLFDEVARTAPVGVVGRVSALGPLTGGLLYTDDVKSVDIEMTWLVKGVTPAPKLRVWNDDAGSSCGGALQKLKVGSQVVFAVRRVGDVKPRPQQFWEDVGFRAPDTDYLLERICGETLKVLATDTQARQWIGKKIR
jgi:hypothetical protein